MENKKPHGVEPFFECVTWNILVFCFVLVFFFALSQKVGGVWIWFWYQIEAESVLLTMMIILPKMLLVPWFVGIHVCVVIYWWFGDWRRLTRVQKIIELEKLGVHLVPLKWSFRKSKYAITKIIKKFKLISIMPSYRYAEFLPLTYFIIHQL